jgi:hypothetical protein
MIFALIKYKGVGWLTLKQLEGQLYFAGMKMLMPNQRERYGFLHVGWQYVLSLLFWETCMCVHTVLLFLSVEPRGGW